MEREEIFVVIEQERQYQNERWVDDPEHTPTEFLLYMYHYLDKARKIATEEDEDVMNPKIMDVMRKIITMGVKCAEVHGLPKRGDILVK